MSKVSIMRDRGLTTEQLDRAWKAEAETNWKVRSLIRSGVNWDDLTDPALLDLIKRQQVYHEIVEDIEPHSKCQPENPNHNCTCFLDPPCSNCVDCPAWNEDD